MSHFWQRLFFFRLLKAGEFLKNTDLDERKIEIICHSIETYRTSKPPWPDTIEGKIVFSADNLSHFDNFKFLVEKGGIDWATNKVKRYIESEYMLPKAVEYAKKMMIKNKIKI